MALTPASPGDRITSTAWNNMITEINGKVTKTGDIMTGPLTVGDVVKARSLSIVDAANTIFPDNWIGMAENIEAATKWLHIGGITGPDTSGGGTSRRIALFATKTYVSGNLGIGTTTPSAKVEIIHDSGGTVNNTQLNLVEIAGNDFARLSFQNNVDRTKAWHIAGFAAGNTNPTLNIWHSDQGDVLSIQTLPKTVFVHPNWKLSFGNQTRQMLNLWSTEYGIGVQSGTLYFRSFSSFAWHLKGVHSDNAIDPGAGGQRLMRLQPGALVVEVSEAWKLGGANTWIIFSDRKLKKRHQII